VKKILTFIATVTLLLAITGSVSIPASFAANSQNQSNATLGSAGTVMAATVTGCNPQQDGTCASCGSGSTGTNGSSDCPCPPNAVCKDKAATSNPANACGTAKGCDLIDKYINPAINLLSVMFGLIIVISLISGALMYITSEGDPQKSANAKGRITKTIIALLAYAFMYGFLEFIVPGGAFNR
jgi:hypothetical protein